MKHRLFAVFSLLLAAITLGGATAARGQLVNIPGLYTTGENTTGLLLGLGSRDTHYVVTANSTGNSGYNGSPFVSQTLPAGWVPNTSSASWLVTRDPTDTLGNILGTSGGNATRPTGTYDFTLSFSLPAGAQLSTVQITGTGAADDVAQIFVNGVLVSGQQLSTYSSLSNFTLNASNAAFVSGTNTITFRVNNSGAGASGLIITNFAGTAIVPEVGTWLPLVGAVGLYGAALHRRKKQTAKNPTENADVA